MLLKYGYPTERKIVTCSSVNATFNTENPFGVMTLWTPNMLAIIGEYNTALKEKDWVVYLRFKIVWFCSTFLHAQIMIGRKHARGKRLKLRAIVTGFSKMKLYKCEFCYNSKAFAQDNNDTVINAHHMSFDCSFNCTCFKNVNYHSLTQIDNIFSSRLKLLNCLSFAVHCDQIYLSVSFKLEGHWVRV